MTEYDEEGYWHWDPYGWDYDGYYFVGIEECACGRAIAPEDEIPSVCPDCGREPWELIADECVLCGELVPPHSPHWVGDCAGDVACGHHTREELEAEGDPIIGVEE